MSSGIYNTDARSEVPEEVKITTHDAIVEAGGRAIYKQTDVDVAEQVEDAVQTALEMFGSLGILVNNDGIAHEAHKPTRVHEAVEEIWDKNIRVNTKSVFLGCKYGIAQMLKEKPHPSSDRGWIIDLNSCASKGAITSPTRPIALDYASDRIHVNAICPGPMLHDVHVGSSSAVDLLRRKQPLNGAGDPDDIARTAVVLASDDASFVTGVCLPEDGGFTIH
ncbi:hypothetical protein BDV29DRAFT_191083 [Aspergillus leporis]|uniref:NAD(P)-binding protein n=1 Tax=Aspergillus leporis TaxID=41062 RepID=A0A5N5X0N1_9EURO|nr:hypothetical protein BDV29DRAFT_191083 [Aspergillus leporis]